MEEKNKKIYILLMHTNTIPSKFIKLFTKYKYSHVAISLEKNCYITYSFGRKKLYNILNGGFCIQKKDGAFFSKFDKTICKIYELEVTEKQYDKISYLISDMEKNTDNYKYDFIGIVLRALGYNIVFKNKFVCSYFVAHILDKSDIYKFKKDVSLVIPKDFETLKDAKEIYNGKYIEYDVKEE